MTRLAIFVDFVFVSGWVFLRVFRQHVFAEPDRQRRCCAWSGRSDARRHRKLTWIETGRGWAAPSLNDIQIYLACPADFRKRADASA